MVAHIQTKAKPGIPPKMAPESTHRNIGPGIANVCSLYTKSLIKDMNDLQYVKGTEG